MQLCIIILIIIRNNIEHETKNQMQNVWMEKKQKKNDALVPIMFNK